MRQVFVTGMLRSGTTLAQMLLTNHPDAFVAYQPFHQFHVDVKRIFLDELGVERQLPLGDDMSTVEGETERFQEWLFQHVFDTATAQRLADESTRGKGGGVPELTGTLCLEAGTFFDLRGSLHRQMTRHFDAEGAAVIGSKEVLCEEYVPALADSGVDCVLVLRDPRAVVASANHGRYHAMVGDRYPLLLLLRLWRKSARHWIGLRAHPRVHVVRYEHLTHTPAAELDRLAEALDLDPFPRSVLEEPLRDHAGRAWAGNSSFGSKSGVDQSSTDTWRELLTEAEAEFIEACTLTELRELGYPTRLLANAAAERISAFIEDEEGVRAGYLEDYRLDPHNRELEQHHLAAGTSMKPRSGVTK